MASTDITDQSRPNGQVNGWAGLRVPYEFVSKFFEVTDQDYVTGAYNVEDQRGATFYIKGRKQSMDGALYDFMSGWTSLKFNNIPHDQTNQSYLPQSATMSYSNVDFPMIRLGEIYLIYAEACLRLGEGEPAVPYLTALSERAGVTLPSELTLDFIFSERARELYWEAHRRTDMVRFGIYTSSDYLWPYKGGDSYAGSSFPVYKTIFPIPPTELATNKALIQNPGY